MYTEVYSSDIPALKKMKHYADLLTLAPHSQSPGGREPFSEENGCSPPVCVGSPSVQTSILGLIGDSRSSN